MKVLYIFSALLCFLLEAQESKQLAQPQTLESNEYDLGDLQSISYDQKALLESVAKRLQVVDKFLEKTKRLVTVEKRLDELKSLKDFSARKTVKLEPVLVATKTKKKSKPSCKYAKRKKLQK